MDQEAAFLEAALPEPVTLLHQQLLPYSLGHDMILTRHKSPFLVQGAQFEIPKVEELYMAVFVCANTYDDAAAGLRLPQAEFNRIIKKWVRLVGRLKAPELLAIMESFQRYVAKGSTCPKFREVARAGQGARRAPGAPWHCWLYNTLTGELNWTREAALNGPLAQSQWHYCAWMERKGTVHIPNTGEEDDLKRLRTEAEKLGWKPMKFARGARTITAEEEKKIKAANPGGENGS